MKRLLITILALALLLSASGQILRYNNYSSPATPPDFYDEYDTVYAAMTTKPSSTIAGYQEDLVYSLDTCDFAGGASVWDRMDFFYVFSNEVNTASEALINWNDPGTFDADNVSSTAFTAYEGFTGDGVADYISTNWIPSSDGTNYTLNSASFGIYLRVNVDEANIAIGCSDGTQLISLRPRAGGTATARVNSSATIAYNTTEARGLWVVTRRGANEVEMYRNGGSVATDTDVSVGLPTKELTILAEYDYNDEIILFSTNQVSIAFVMNQISDAEATAINTIIETYMDALNKGVQ